MFNLREGQILYIIHSYLLQHYPLHFIRGLSFSHFLVIAFLLTTNSSLGIGTCLEY